MRAFFALLSAVWRYAGEKRMWVVTYVLLFSAANAINLFEPYVIGNVLNVVQTAGSNPDALREIVYALLGILALTMGFWVLHGPARTLEVQTAFYVRQQFKDRLYGVVSGLPVQWHKDNHSGQTIDKISKATGSLYDFTANTFQFIEMAVRLIGSVVALALLMPIAALLAISASMGALLIVFVFDLALIRWYRTLNQYDHYVAQALHDYLTNITTVITLRLERLTRSELLHRMTVYFPFFRRMVRVGETKWFLVSFLVSATTVGILIWYAASEIRSGRMPLAGTFFMLYNYLQKIGGAFYTFAGKYGATVQQYANLQSVDAIMGTEQRGTPDVRLPDDWRRVMIRNLNFLYHGEGHRTYHLKDVDIILERGKKIALVGESGSGKSTLLALIRGIQTTDEVQVYCDRVILPEGLRHLQAHVTLLPQDPEIFSNTIEYNITVDTEQSHQEVMEDVELAQFASVLDRLPHGLETHISEKGVNLSGGEKQRLALARGFFAARASDIILLDEPTSSVDSRNERRIYENLFRTFGDRCIVSSIHRLHLLPMFDEIYVLEKGEVKEVGSFEDLIAKNGIFARMWAAYRESGGEQGRV